MLDAQRLRFVEKFDDFGVSNWRPYLPLTLTYQASFLEVSLSHRRQIKSWVFSRAIAYSSFCNFRYFQTK
jgi:hypothetical protein